MPFTAGEGIKALVLVERARETCSARRLGRLQSPDGIEPR